MGWKHIDTLQMGPSSTKERVVNVVKVRSNGKVNQIQRGGRKRKNQIQREDRRIKDMIKRGYKGRRNRNAQVVRVNSPGIRDSITEGRKYAISINKKMTTYF